MRFRDFVAVVIISTCTSLLVVWALINAGVIQTQQQIPQQQPIKQTHTGTLTGVYNETSQKYEAYIEKIPIENVSNKASIRLLHISFEANIINYNYSGWVDIKALQLKDQQTQIVVTEKDFRFKQTSYGVLNIDTGVNPTRAFYMSLRADGIYNFTLTYNLTIIQEIFT